MTIYKRERALRDWLVSTHEAARALHITENRIRTLSREGYIKPSRHKGFYRLGDVIDGLAEAVKMGAIARPLDRSNNRPDLPATCPTVGRARSGLKALRHAACRSFVQCRTGYSQHSHQPQSRPS